MLFRSAVVHQLRTTVCVLRACSDISVCVVCADAAG